MEDRSEGESREHRAARNQSLFRAVNEKLRQFNEAFQAVTDRHEIACECADLGCVQVVEITADEYAAVREHPRRFVVCLGHAAGDIETVVSERGRYLVVEKIGVAGEVAEAIAEQAP